MGLERKCGLTRHRMRGSISTERNMEGARSTGQTGLSIRENLMKITLRARGFTNGQTGASTVVIGSIIRCMVKACSHGLTEEGTKAAMYKIKNKVTARSSGLTAKSMWATGLTAGSMAAECI